MSISKMMQTLWADKRGVTAVEYGLIAALIAAVIATGVGTLGTSLSTKIGSVNTALTTPGG